MLSWGVEPVMVDTRLDRRDRLVCGRTLRQRRADRQGRRRRRARRIAGAARIDRRRRAARRAGAMTPPCRVAGCGAPLPACPARSIVSVAARSTARRDDQAQPAARGRFRVARYDRRGYGRSMQAGPFGIDDQVDDLVDVIASAPMRRRRACSDHSTTATASLARRASSRTRRGVVVYEVPLSWLPWWPGTTAGGDARAWEHDPAGAAERFMRRLIGDARWALPAATQAPRAEGSRWWASSAIWAEAPWSRERMAPVLAMRSGRAAITGGDERSPTGSTAPRHDRRPPLRPSHPDRSRRGRCRVALAVTRAGVDEHQQQQRQ